MERIDLELIDPGLDAEGNLALTFWWQRNIRAVVWSKRNSANMPTDYVVRMGKDD